MSVVEQGDWRRLQELFEQFRVWVGPENGRIIAAQEARIKGRDKMRQHDIGGSQTTQSVGSLVTSCGQLEMPSPGSAVCLAGLTDLFPKLEAYLSYHTVSKISKLRQQPLRCAVQNRQEAW
jgi:hypothetical protein